MKRERIKLIVDVDILYENKKGRGDAVNVAKEVFLDICGAGPNGCYEAKSINAVEAKSHQFSAPSSDLVRALGLPDGSDWGSVELAAMQVAAHSENETACHLCEELAAMVDVTRHMGCNMGTNSDYVAVQVAHGEAILDGLCQILGVSSHAEIVHAVRLLGSGGKQ